LPIDNYESLSTGEILESLPGLSPAQLRTVREYEAAHQGRVDLLQDLDSRLAG
jgi:hypothetical protein